MSHALRHSLMQRPTILRSRYDSDSDSDDGLPFVNVLEAMAPKGPFPDPLLRFRLLRKQTVPPALARRFSEVVAERLQMDPSHVRRMRSLRLPRWLYRFLAALAQTHPGLEDLDMIEWFSGVESLVAAWERDGYSGFGYDKNKHHELMDLCRDAGFVFALWLSRRLRSNTGFQSFGTVCSSWVWMSRSGTKRRSGQCMGDTSSFVVATANMMVSRACLLKRLGLARRIAWVLEQPFTSLMGEHPRMVDLRSGPGTGGVYQCSTYMGAFGAPTAKKTRLWSSESWITAMARPLPTNLLRQSHVQTSVISTSADGRKQVTGGRDLKASQAYPTGYGLELRRQHEMALNVKQVDKSDDDLKTEASTEDEWEDCKVHNLQCLLWDADGRGHVSGQEL